MTSLDSELDLGTDLKKNEFYFSIVRFVFYQIVDLYFSKKIKAIIGSP